MEQSKQLQTETATDYKVGWTADDRKKIASIVFPLLEIQKAYGRVLNAKLVMQGWEIILAEKYSAEQIVYALKQYALKYGDDFPTPKNLNEILDPSQPRITEAAFVEAQKYQERNGWPMFSDAQETIDAYRAQEKEKQSLWKVDNEKLLEIAASSVKKIPALLDRPVQQAIEGEK